MFWLFKNHRSQNRENSQSPLFFFPGQYDFMKESYFFLFFVVGEAKRHLEINIDTNIPTGQSNCGGGLTWASWCKKPTKNHLKISAPRDCLWPVIRTENGKNSKYSKIGQYWMPPLEPLQATMSSNVGVNNNLRLGWRYSKKQETKFPTGSLGCGGQSW